MKLTNSTSQRLTSFSLLLLGLAFAYVAFGYGIGSVTSMRPGFFPFALGLLLAALATIDLIQNAVGRVGAGGSPGLELRRMLCVCGSLVSFALLLHRAGFLPAIFVASALATLAEPGVRWTVTAAYAVGLTMLSYAVFILGLGMPVKAFWW